MDEALSTFFAECEEMLEQMEQCLLALERTPGDAETLNALFRAAHTIKGSAGLFGFGHVVAFTHEVETVLEALRAGRLAFGAELVSALLPSMDRMRGLIGEARAEPLEPAQTGAALTAEERALVARLRAITGEQGPGESEGAAVVHAAPGASPAAAAEGSAEGRCWHISVRCSPRIFTYGLDPLALIRYLGGLGRLDKVSLLCDRLPARDAFDPETCYLGFEIRLETDATRERIDAAFEFFREECSIAILPPRAALDDYLRLLRDPAHDSPRLGEILVACGALSAAELDRALGRQSAAGGPPLGEVLVQEGVVAPAVVEAALEKQSRLREPRAEEPRFIRVNADKLDTLIGLVGELVIAGAGANLVARQLRDERMAGSTQAMMELVEEIRNEALGLRMVPVGETFARFRRVVRDVSRQLGKQVELVIEGAETELDKSVVERVADPLMHLVRNCLDHGIELPDERVRAGKPAAGCVRLTASHDSGSVLIAVQDDGRGLDRARIRAKAEERGLVSAGATLSDRELLELIFLPGFSTADAVTDLSGRGVGMDVVRRNIEQLRGSVNLASEPGRGTRFSIRLPLTLAIIDGFLVTVGEAHYVLPLDAVEECIEAQADLKPARGCLNLRGRTLPYLDLASYFGHPAPAPGRRSVVVVRTQGMRAGLVVDRLLGEFQTVIKPLGRLFRGLRGVAGSTILGSGAVGLILDVGALLAAAGEQERGAGPRSAVQPESLSR